MKRYALLVNRASGGNQRGLDATTVCGTVETIFREAGHGIESTLVEPGGVEAALHKAILTKPDAILVGGGDGTVSTAATFLGGKNIALGVLPMGTFNLAARDLGVPLDIGEAARFLAAADVFPIDVLDVSGKACICTTILGFYPDFADIFENRDHKGRWWRKTLKLLARMPGLFSKARPIHLSWVGDCGIGSARTKFSAFVPGKYRDVTGLVPVRTDFRTGTMTAYIGTHQRSASAVRGIFDYVLGRQEQDAHLHILKARKMTLLAARRKQCNVMLDGEILRMTFPIELHIMPDHLLVLTTAEIMAQQLTVAE